MITNRKYINIFGKDMRKITTTKISQKNLVTLNENYQSQIISKQLFFTEILDYYSIIKGNIVHVKEIKIHMA